MRYNVEQQFWPHESPRRRPEIEGADFANLHAAIAETLRHFDEQIRAAEQELEVLRVLHTVPVARSAGRLDDPENDNGS